MASCIYLQSCIASGKYGVESDQMCRAACQCYNTCVSSGKYGVESDMMCKAQCGLNSSGNEMFRGSRHAVKNTLSKGAKIGIGIGAAVLILLIIYFLLSKSRGAGMYYF